MIWLGSSRGLGLEFHAHPAVALVAAAVAAGHHCVGEREECVLVPTVLAEPGDVELELVVEHRLQPVHRDVAAGLAVDRVTDCHVVRGDGLRDGARCAAGTEEPARHLLPGADLGDRAVPPWVEVDPERLLQGLGGGSVHSGKIAPEDYVRVSDRRDVR